MSVNLLLQDEEQAVVWRGPLISRVIEQFWRDTAWGELDYLIVDLPPGTSDAALTVTQSLPLRGNCPGDVAPGPGRHGGLQGGQHGRAPGHPPDRSR
jgi:Mrp family chromosome partitioning ATPase